MARALGSVLLLAAVACGSDSTAPATLCTGAVPVQLAVGQYSAVDPALQSGCTAYAANPSDRDSAEYLVVPLSASGTPGLWSGFVLTGGPAGGPPTAASGAVASPQEVAIAERFHDGLRQREQRHTYGLSRPVPAAPLAAPLTPGPPAVGGQRTFSVCASLDCSQFQSVVATARVVSGRIALYMDTTAAGSLAQADFDALAATFTDRLYPIDTTAFGTESDIDGNVVVDVLMTPVVNKLVTADQCALSGYVTGFFYGFDLDPAAAGDLRSNHGEVFYALVPDSLGSLSCPHTARAVRGLLPLTFIHEFQHMISFNQHVLVRGGAPEALWLNEGMSHFAEELGGRSYLPGDAATFSTFVLGDVSRAYDYLSETGNHYLVPSAGIASLPERGAAWLFVRYLADRFADDTSFAAVARFTRTLLATTETGAENVRVHSGVAFDMLVERWALANYVSDLPGFAPAPELRYQSWRFRTTFASLHLQNPLRFPAPFPLVPAMSNGAQLNLAGTLYAGSGVFERVVQAPRGSGFALRFLDGSGAALSPDVVPRLTVLRIR